MVESRQTERLRRFYDEYAGDYDRWMRFYDSIMLGGARRKVCSRASGRTLELAIGTGLNLSYLPGRRVAHGRRSQPGHARRRWAACAGVGR